MNLLKKIICLKCFICIIMILYNGILKAQTMHLVWADEFNENELDLSNWEFEIGPTNDNVHYYTERSENVYLDSGFLKIAALKEQYQGWNYTSGLIKTENIHTWNYGRIEARIKLPQTPGFVPAFWLLPVDKKYGWWPYSGEIDIMEHPTNEIEKIYGTIHSFAFSSFTGTSPKGSTINIADAETVFHVYAVEWSPDKIDFFVDDQKYFTFNNDLNGYESWPFDQPFYIILNLAVGGGWVGTPNESSIFPAIMEVDYVRVYQKLTDIQITGNDYYPRFYEGADYSLPFLEGATYLWHVTGDAEIVSGQNTNKISVNWNTFSGDVKGEIFVNETNYQFSLPVSVSNNYLKNYGFEKGVAYWNKTRPFPGDINFTLDSDDPHKGKNCLKVAVNSQSTNPWDVQLSQRNLMLESGKQYSASFWAKADIQGTKLSGAIINSTSYAPLVIQEFTLTDVWTKYDLSFTSSSNVTGQFNIDMGGHLGTYYFDDFVLSSPELIDNSNQIINADFSDGDNGWIFNSFSQAQATGQVINGEYAVNITNGGVDLWDIHLGQANVICANGKEYTVSFDAYADAPRTISALVGKNSEPWTIYSGDQIINLTTEKTRYTYSFIMNYPTDNQARLGFDLGTSSVDLYFDNISLSRGKIPTIIDENKFNIVETFQLYQNYPNPFNPSTVIKYQIPKESFVTLKIYDVLGDEVETLVSEIKSAGIYTIEWNSKNLSTGIYFYKLTSGEFIKVIKMLLVK